MDYMPTFGGNTAPMQETALPADDTAMQLELKRRLKMAEALQQQELPQGQMVSGHYVAPSWTQYLANAIGKYQGAKQEKEALGQFGEYQKGKQAKLANLLTDLGQGKTEPMDYNEAGNMPGMEQTTPFSQKEYMARVLQTMPELAPKFLEANLTNQFKEETPLVVGNNLISKTGKVLYSAPEKENKLFGTVTPSDFTPESLNKFSQTKNYADLIPTAKPEAFKAPPFRTIMQGGNEIQQELQRDGTWKEVGRGARFKPESEMPLDAAVVNMLADQALTGDTSVFTGMGSGTQGAKNRLAIRQVMNQKMLANGLSGKDIAAANAEFFGAKAGERTLGVRGANVELAASEFQNILPLAQQASTQVARSGLLPFGKVQVMFDEQTNDPTLRQFAAANNGVVNTYARAISPTGIPTVSDKEHARKLLSTAMNNESYQATLNMLNQEIAAARKSPSQVRADMRGEISGRGKPAGLPSSDDIAAEIARRKGK